MLLYVLLFGQFDLLGCSFLCVPPDVDPVLQDDLLHDHLHDLQEYPRHHTPGDRNHYDVLFVFT
jgi:hypothetical protein